MLSTPLTTLKVDPLAILGLIVSLKLSNYLITYKSLPKVNESNISQNSSYLSFYSKVNLLDDFN